MSAVAARNPSTPKILKEDQVPLVTKLHAFKLLRKLAGTSRQVPKSYLVGPLSGFKVERIPFATGGFSDVRKGRYRGMDVAVKTIRVSQVSDIKVIHEVGRAVNVPFLTIDRYEIPNLERLQGMRSVDERVPSQRFATHRSQNQTRRRQIFNDF